MRRTLFLRTQDAGESFEFYHAALTAQAVKTELGTLEDELVRDLFISKMKNAGLQDTLTFETFTLDEILKRAKQTDDASIPKIVCRYCKCRDFHKFARENKTKTH